MIIDTHVFLGPSLDKETATNYLGDAYYHPPIQCGDVIRLLRLPVKRILIIDGLYEQVPAVWHKELMLALDRGIELYGAASMGALRAAEMHHYGMVGIGQIFNAFHSNLLNDDDEVAVLHHNVDQNYQPINDALVNIRKTLEVAYQQKIIDLSLQQALLNWCKAKFYPQRSLLTALKFMPEEYKPACMRLAQWIKVHGMVDLKRSDAIEALSEVQKRIDLAQENNPVFKFNDNPNPMYYTKFIGTLVDEVIGTPFIMTQPWFSNEEKKLAALASDQPEEYRLIKEFATLIHYSMNVANYEGKLAEREYLKYIKDHQLYYCPELLLFFNTHQYLAPLSHWILHFTCLANVRVDSVNSYVPAMAFYYNLKSKLGFKQGRVLSWLVLFILLLNQQLDDPYLEIKTSLFKEHLQEIGLKKRYTLYRSSLSEAPSFNLKKLFDIILTYMKVIYIHQGMKDFKLGLAKVPHYFNWIYDAMALYELNDIEARKEFVADKY